MWYLDYHGFEATIQLSTGRNGTPTSNMVRIRTGYLLANQDIPPSYSFKLHQSWTFLRYFHPVPRKRVRLGILPHMPRNALTYTRRHTFSTVLTCTMSSSDLVQRRKKDRAALWQYRPELTTTSPGYHLLVRILTEQGWCDSLLPLRGQMSLPLPLPVGV